MSETVKNASGEKKDNTVKIVLIVVGVLVGLGVLAIVATTLLIGSFVNRAGKEAGVTGTYNNESGTLKANDGDTTINYGSSSALPDGFPSDVPIYQPSTILGSTKTNEELYTVSISTDDTPDKVGVYYKTELPNNGWTQTLDSSQGDSIVLLFQKQGVQTSISTSTRMDGNKEITYISISVNSLE